MAQPKLDLRRNRWSISDILIVTTFLSLVLALRVVLKIEPVAIALVFAILCSRVLAIVHARNLFVSLPSLATALAIPIIVNWNEIQHAWNTTNRPDPLTDWVSWILIYPLPIVAAWAWDFIMNWTSRSTLYVRFVIEAPVLISWIVVTSEIYYDIAGSHR